MTRWLPIPGFPGYEASDDGNVRSLDRVVEFKDGRRRSFPGKVLKPNKWREYRVLVLRGEDGRRRTAIVARFVLMAHRGPKPFPDAVIRHLNDDSTDDRLDNLAWGTRLENTADRIRNGNDFRGEKHPSSRLTESDVVAIRAEVSAGRRQREVAVRYGVNPSVISRIVGRKRWTHL